MRGLVTTDSNSATGNPNGAVRHCNHLHPVRMLTFEGLESGVAIRVRVRSRVMLAKEVRKEILGHCRQVAQARLLRCRQGQPVRLKLLLPVKVPAFPPVVRTCMGQVWRSVDEEIPCV